MADFSTLIAAVKAAIYTNHEGAITAQVLQDVLVGAAISIVKDINDEKQDTLVSGTNIKTVGGKSLLGAGDLPVDGDLLYWGTILQGGDNDMSNVGEITIGGITYDSGTEFLDDTDACKVGRVIAQINPTAITPGVGYDYYEVTRFVITGVDDMDGILTLGNVVSSADITTIVKMTQAEYDLITPDPNTLYIITE